MRDAGRHTADFFGSQEGARARSALLLVYYNLTVALIIAALYFLAAFFVVPPKDVIDRVSRTGDTFFDNINRWLPTGYLIVSRDPWDRDWWRPSLLYPIAASVALAIYGAAAWKLAMLRRIGGRGVAESMGATLLNRRSPTLTDQQFWNTVEEMSIAAEMPMPAAFVLEREGHINAFAAGHAPKDAAIGITRGALNLLSREEIQGIVAHEFSHVVNGDMRLNTRLIGMLHGLVFVADIGERIMYAGLGGEGESDCQRAGSPAWVIVGAAIQLVGSAGVALAQIIKAAVSRQREFLADAAALQYTRNPDAIAGALRKIAAMAGGGTIRAAGRSAVSHAFFCNALSGLGRGLLSTHPPIVDRILAVDPQWDGSLPEIDTNRLPATGSARRIGEVAIDPDRGRAVEARMGVELARMIGIAAATASPTPDDPLLAASRTTDGAPGLILAMLLPREPRLRDRALKKATPLLTQAWLRETTRLWEHLDGRSATDKLQLAEYALPALRTLPPEAFRQFEGAAAELIAADDDLDLFEYALDKLFERHLAPYFRHPSRPSVEFQSIEHLADEACALLSIVARATTHPDDAASDVAFRAGVHRLRLYTASPRLRDAPDCGLGTLDAAIQRLLRAADYVREDMLAACHATATTHGDPTDHQRVLLRAIADGLECHSRDRHIFSP